MKLAALALSLLLQGGEGGLVAPPRAVARWIEAPRAVELGMPFELVLEIAHAAGDAPRIGPGGLESDPAWAVLEGGVPLALPDLADPRARVSEVRWSVVALEPGRRALPAPLVRYESSDGAPAVDVAVEVAVEIEVAGVLAEGEDAPRPLPPDLGVDEPAAVSDRLALASLAAGLIALAALAAFLVARRRRRARALAPREPTPLERLAALEESALDDAAAVRAAHVALTRLLRAHVDGARARDALTDEEWLAALALPQDGELARLFADCRPVEYGGELPTHWATRERVARARALATGIGGAP